MYLSIYNRILLLGLIKLITNIISLIVLIGLTQYLHRTTNFQEISTIMKPQTNAINLTFYDSTGSLINKIFQDSLLDFHSGYYDLKSQKEFIQEFINSNHKEIIQKKFENFMTDTDNEIWVDTKKLSS